MTSTTSDLPVIPLQRAAQCPLAPPIEFESWREEPGLHPAGEESTPVIFARIDDPEHRRLRRMMTSQFTFRRTEAMRPQIQELVDHYLDKMIDKGPPADIVRDFALPVPSMVIALLLGVPPEDLGLFQHNTTVGLETTTS